jgi:hypothetical protein
MLVTILVGIAEFETMSRFETAFLQTRLHFLTAGCSPTRCSATFDEADTEVAAFETDQAITIVIEAVEHFTGAIEAPVDEFGLAHATITIDIDLIQRQRSLDALMQKARAIGRWVTKTAIAALRETGVGDHERTQRGQGQQTENFHRGCSTQY